MEGKGIERYKEKSLDELLCLEKTTECVEVNKDGKRTTTNELFTVTTLQQEKTPSNDGDVSCTTAEEITDK